MNNNRNARVISAEQTMQIIDSKQYEIDGKTIDLSSLINYSLENTELYKEEILDALVQGTQICNTRCETNIIVKNCSTMEAGFELDGKGKTGCLNFASANNPGGGFLSGAQAQEESLSRASTLYPTQLKFFDQMYEYNRARRTYLYSDRMIYSPSVVFFKDDSDHLLAKPYCMDVLTSPAVNVGAMIQNNRPDELLLSEKTMMDRIDKILTLFYVKRVQNLILGAWGCGVFRNNPIDIARYFAHYIKDGGKYSQTFENIIFAVYDRSKTQENIKAFENAFME